MNIKSNQNKLKIELSDTEDSQLIKSISSPDIIINKNDYENDYEDYKEKRYKNFMYIQTEYCEHILSKYLKIKYLLKKLTYVYKLFIE